MTFLTPTLSVRRLAIRSEKGWAYDEIFHTGINVIRGENSSGKSALLNMLFYGIGGDYVDWSDAALRCQEVFVEVSLNSFVVTLRRAINPEQRQPMLIFAGVLDDAKMAPPSSWTQYPYARSSKESFSQAIFRLLGIPEFSSDATGSITLHQVMRILYSDQLSPIENLFRKERFDTGALRDAIGRLLCGAYDTEVYENYLQLKKYEKEYSAASEELRAIHRLLGEVDEDLTVAWLLSEHARAEAELEKARRDLAQISLVSDEGSNQLSLKEVEERYRSVTSAQKRLSDVRKARQSLELELADSARFIDHLKNKIKRLQEAAAAAKGFGEIEFMQCPACMAQLEHTDVGHCHLCKTPRAEDHAANRFVHMINEAARQLLQSEQIQRERLLDLEKAKRIETLASQRWRSAASRYEDARGVPSTAKEQAIKEFSRKTGYIERELEAIAQKLIVVRRLEEISDRKERLSAEISRLKSRNQRLLEAQEVRFDQARAKIGTHLARLLRKDLRRQDAFEDPQEIWFDFSGDRATVDNQLYFSASSRVILKNSFFLAFLLAAVEDPRFRHPRFCIIDTIEEHGVEPVRSHNFQNNLVEELSAIKVDHQIIFATANISPDLEDDRFTVGRYYTRDEPTLIL